MHDLLLDRYERRRTGCLGVLVGIAIELVAAGFALLLVWRLR